MKSAIIVLLISILVLSKGMGNEDFTTTDFCASSEVIAGLGLKADSSPQEVKNAFERLGIKFRAGMKAALLEPPSPEEVKKALKHEGVDINELSPETFENKRLVVTNTFSEMHKIEGIIFLLSQGFKISK